MPYELSPAMRAYAEGQVAKGAFPSIDKVVEAALLRMRDQENERELLSVAFQQLENGEHHPLNLAEIREMGQHFLAEAIAQDERGEHVPFDVEKILAEGRAEQRRRRASDDN